MFTKLSRRAKPRFVSGGCTVCEPLELRRLLSTTPFRPPAVPLVTSDPYLSVWSESDQLNASNTVHWTGSEQSLVSLIRIDGTSYRLMGDDPSSLPAFPQTGLQVLPTRSIYDFDNGHVHVTMTFMTPALASDLSAISLPVSYINWDVRSVDGQTHSVQVYDSVSSELAVNTTDEQVIWQREATGGLTALRVGTTTQNYFDVSGDQVGIDWGYAYLAATASQVTSSIGGDAAELSTFTSAGKLTNTDDAATPRAVDDNMPVMAMAFDLASVGSADVQRHVIVAYDEVKSVDYFGQSLTPYWRRNGTTVEQMLATASNNYAGYVTRTAAFDTQLMTDMTSEGGAEYAQLGALAYRQTFAGMGLAADPSGQLLAFPKENSSNGDVSTVDVLYPMFPQLLLFSPTIAKAALEPVLDYSSSPLWTFPNAPHDLGTYPLVLGRPDGGEAMPVEETANMLIMLDGIAKAEHSSEFADRFWPVISGWAGYLEPYAYTPGMQLTTDDFLGVITNSTNLAAKAIIGLGAFADLAKLHGDTASAASFTAAAEADVTHWMSQSLSSDGTHWVLSYGDSSSFAQQYNLVWDSILGTDLFPASVAAKEVAYEKSIVTPYGVPIRSTTNYVGVDWSSWAAALATNTADFEAIEDPLYTYLNTTTARVPMRDKLDDTNLGGGLFQARTVVGGVFAKMLTDPAMWAKYAGQDKNPDETYAGFPTKTVVLPSAEESAQTWSYTTATPAAGWQNPGFDDSSWSAGPGGFGTAGTPGLIENTTWNTDDIYLRKSFTMPAGAFSNLQLEVYHDESVEIYFNGVLAASATGYVTNYVTLPISAAAQAQLVAAKAVTIAVHCNQTVGGQGVDVGIVSVQPGVRPGTVEGTVTGGKAGETVYLDANNNGKLDAGELSTTTYAGGAYSFSNVPVGSYIVRQVLPSGYSQSSPSSGYGIHIALTAGALLTNDNFTDKAAAVGGSISGAVTGGSAGETIYLDANNNGKFDAGELSTTTSSTGTYQFTGVPAGAYIVRQVLPSGYTQVSPAGGYGIHLSVANGSSFTGENFTDQTAAHTPLTGATIGTAGSYNNDGNTIAKATDGNLGTFFDSAESSGSWVGLDLGSAKSISQIEFAPRSGYASRMIGGSFQISTTADFSSGVTTLYTITAAPASNILTSVALSSPVTARYVRYLSPAASHGDIAEFEVFG